MSGEEIRVGVIVLDLKNIMCIWGLNYFDIVLYLFVEKFFFERINYFKRKDEEEMLFRDF